MLLTPSSINSFMRADSSARALSLAPAGRKKMLAEPTPYTVATKATAIPWPDQLDLIQMLHHLNEAQHCADNPDGRSISTCSLIHLGFGPTALLIGGDLQVHHLLQFLEVSTIDA